VAGQARVALFKSIAAVLERLPERLDVGLARSLAPLVSRRTKSARLHLGDNLTHVLAVKGTPVEPELLESFVDRGFASYGQYWAESAKLPALKSATITSRFVIAEGMEHLLEAKARGKGIVIALPHIGSWEWWGALLASLGLPMTAVAEELEPRELFEWFKSKRQSIGINIAPLDAHAGTTLLQTLREGGVVGLLCDRDIQENGLMVDFFGERVTIPAGPATLALRTGATLVAAACYSGPGRDHHAVVTPPINTERSARLRDDVERVTQAIATELEGLIRRAPEQWHVLQPRFADS
jgi:phosphatidylinositol dimannoside acyltransferase